jgi:addiction module HigA family antidote
MQQLQQQQVVLVRVTHPGELLGEELARAGLSLGAAARCMAVAPMVVSDIIAGRAGVTAGIALRLAALLGGKPERWLEAQNAYDLAEARKVIGTRLKKIRSV